MILKSIIDKKDAGRKIKYYVQGDLGVSYTQFNSLKVTGGLVVNGITVHANYILREGDSVEVILPANHISSVEPAQGEVSIAYEDDDILIIDKPAPLACQSSSRNSAPALENYLMARFGPEFVFRPLNRLDKGTSGLMCAAKHAHAYQLLQKQLHGDDFLREYLAVVRGHMEGDGTIDLPIAKIDAASVKRVVDFERGKSSVTHYHCEGCYGSYSVVRLRLETGRTHQIRVHLSHIGHPIAGDFLYGEELSCLPLRFALHSARIRLIQPISREIIDKKSALPMEMRALIGKDVI